MFAEQMTRLNLPKEKTFVGPALVWKRIAAFFIDIVIINLIVLLPFKSLFEGIVPKEYTLSEAYRLLSTSTNYTSYINSIAFVISMLVVLYFTMLESRMGQSIGKFIMKIYVVSETNSLKTWQTLVRNLVFIPIFPFILLWIVEPLFMFFTKTNQRLTEILSKTKVVERYSLSQ